MNLLFKVIVVLVFDVRIMIQPVILNVFFHDLKNLLLDLFVHNLIRDYDYLIMLCMN